MMSDPESNDEAVFPMELVSKITKSQFYIIEAGDVNSTEDRELLLRRMFDSPEDSFYYFTPRDAGVDREMDPLRGSVNFNVMEAYYYAHPNFNRDYVRISPGKVNFDWENEARKGQEYLRFTLTLTERQRRQMSALESLALEKDLKEKPDLITINPKFGWITVDGKQMLKLMRARWKHLLRRSRNSPD